MRDFRAEQCAWLPDRGIAARGRNWVPKDIKKGGKHPTPINLYNFKQCHAVLPVCDSLCNSFAVLADTLKCKLACEDAETHEVIKVKEDVIDGTLCSYDIPNDICVRGRCRVSRKIC